MDRRQQKSRAAIISSFRKLLKTHRYEEITVQDIIDAANVGRSTFYAHFETKDALLDAMCRELIGHVLESTQPSDVDCAYVEDQNDLVTHLAHILFHLKEIKSDVQSLLRSNGSQPFFDSLADKLMILFRADPMFVRWNVPPQYAEYIFVSGFLATVRWWASNGMKESPETVARYFLSIHRS